MKSFDAVVIGGGPAGMTAALYFLRSGLQVAFVEKLSHGGQMLTTERIDNYPAFPGGAFAFELADRMLEQLKEYANDAYKYLNDEVKTLEPGQSQHRVLIGEEWIAARSVVICTGARYKKLGLPSEKRLMGRGVSYCALCDGNFFRDQVVAVIGGGNSALEEALYLTRLVKKLYLIHRREDFRGAKCYQDKCIVNPKIEILRSSVVEEIIGEERVSGIRIHDLKQDQARTINVDGVFVFVGFEPVHGFLPDSLELDTAGFIVTDQECRTSIPGIFAAGDVRSKLCRQVATAVGDGATAATAAMSYLEGKHAA